MRELCPTTEDWGVCRENAVALRNAVEPSLDLCGLRCVLFSRNFYSRLYFANGDGGNVQRLLRCGLDPSDDTLVGFELAQLGNNIRLEQIHPVSLPFEMFDAAGALAVECSARRGPQGPESKPSKSAVLVPAN